MKHYFMDYLLLKVRYRELLAKSERQRKQIAMLEKSRADIRADLKTLRGR